MRSELVTWTEGLLPDRSHQTPVTSTRTRLFFKNVKVKTSLLSLLAMILYNFHLSPAPLGSCRTCASVVVHGSITVHKSYQKKWKTVYFLTKQFNVRQWQETGQTHTAD